MDDELDALANAVKIIVNNAQVLQNLSILNTETNQAQIEMLECLDESMCKIEEVTLSLLEYKVEAIEREINYEERLLKLESRYE